MVSRYFFRVGLGLSILCSAVLAADRVRTSAGVVEGTSSASSQVRVFKGIPFAAPPVGQLRWQAPQPVLAWKGVRKADVFGSRCMQGAIFSDMIFRDAGPSEDCLHLNVWTPAKKSGAKLPVMVWIYGGGFQAGAASEPRQDGENLAQKGVVVVSLNYRLGVFGFFVHPELTKESPHHASGNYGLMDQTAALAWVQKNVEAFGGDPGNVTIFGESAGSMSVSAQMVTPLAKGLFKQAIGESGAVLPLTPGPTSLEKREQAGVDFARSIGANSLQDLRAMPAEKLLQAALAVKDYRFWPNTDGYFYPRDPVALYAAGQQAHVPLLAGWNTDEQSAAGFFGKDPMTKEAYENKIRQLYGDRADDVLKLYPDETEEQMQDSARDLAGDQFIAYSTWKWLDEQVEMGGVPVYRYHFEQVTPSAPGKHSRGAFHSSDIEYVFETLDSEKLPWTEADKKTSDMMATYWSNFAKTGDPNGAGLPKWEPYSKDQYSVMHLGVPQAAGTAVGAEAAGPLGHAAPDKLRARYLLLDSIAKQRASMHGDASTAQ